VSASLKTAGSGAELAQASQRRSSSARVLHLLAILMILTGVLALLDALVTVVWQEPITALYALIEQDHLSGALRKAERTPPTPVERRTLASLPDEQARITFLAREFERRSGNGAAVGRIWIPRIDASYVVVKGTDTEDLKSGPGIYSETSFPGIPGTTAIAGHRTTYLAPFREINLLKPGNRIVLSMPYAHFTYTVTGQRVVWPDDVSAAVAQIGHSRLVLSACTPLFTAEKRLLVYARLTRTVPVGAARLLPGGAVPRPIEAPPRALPAQRGGRALLPAMLVSLDPHSVSPLA
jgi:sortase A